MSFTSEEQWVEVSTCLCGAPVYRMGDKYRCPDCCCNSTINYEFIKRGLGYGNKKD